MSTVLQMIELRTGSVADLPLVDSIMKAAFDPRFGEAWTHNQCLGILALPGVWLTIATIDGAPAGFALCRLIADEAELLLLATVPTMRRRGVASALLRAVIADSVREGARKLHLEVREGNDAIKLYQGTAFIKVGERRDYYRGTSGQAFHAFTYSRELP